MKNLVHGFGITDILTGKVAGGKLAHDKSYIVWSGMLRRCYSKKSLIKYPSYNYTIVCPEWKVYSNFKKWFDKNYIEGYEIDKDVKSKHPIVKMYCPEECCFIPRWLNTLLNNCSSVGGEWPAGVCFAKGRGKFRARYSMNGRSKHIGHFDTSKQAGEAYLLAKGKHICEIAKAYPDKKVSIYLYRFGLDMLNQIEIPFNEVRAA